MTLMTKSKTFKTGEELVDEIQRLYLQSKETVILLTQEATEAIHALNRGLFAVSPTFCERWGRLKTIYLNDENGNFRLVEFEKPYDVETIYLFDV